MSERSISSINASCSVAKAVCGVIPGGSCRCPRRITQALSFAPNECSPFCADEYRWNKTKKKTVLRISLRSDPERSRCFGCFQTMETVSDFDRSRLIAALGTRHRTEAPPFNRSFSREQEGLEKKKRNVVSVAKKQMISSPGMTLTLFRSKSLFYVQNSIDPSAIFTLYTSGTCKVPLWRLSDVHSSGDRHPQRYRAARWSHFP